MKTEEQPIKGVKGFDQNLTCRNFKYELGKEFETTDKPVRCTSHGFHFCENPIHVFEYYPPAGSKFHEVEGSGQVDREENSDTNKTKLRPSVC